MKAIIHNSHSIINTSFYGSKSIAHRLLIAAFLSKRPIQINNLPDNDDVKATINCLEKLGAEINLFLDNHSCNISTYKIEYQKELELDVGNSGSTLRFLLPISLNFASKVKFKCGDSLINRPIDVYKDLEKDCNLVIKKEGNYIICSGKINLDYYEVNQNISSQFISGLIINAIYLNTPCTIKLSKQFESISYIHLTCDIFNSLGFDISYNDNIYYIHSGSIITSSIYSIEGDYGSASYLLALGAMNGKIEAFNLNNHSNEPNVAILEYLKKIGCYIKYIDKDKYIYAANNSLLEKGIKKSYKAINFDIAECIDLGPLIMVLASFLNGTSIISNVDRLKYKESNRLEAMISILSSLHVNIHYEDNKVIIIGKKDYHEFAKIKSYNDHRIVMAIAVFALMNNGVIEIEDIECVNKSFKEFFDILINSSKKGAIELI